VATLKRKSTKKKTSNKKAGKTKVAEKAVPAAPRPALPAKIPGPSKSLSPKAQLAVKKASDSLWDVGTAPHILLQELHELLLLRCLHEAEGNYAQAASKFGPSRQSVQQYANHKLRDERWKPYQHSRRRKAAR
jgi:hypothetical protein